MDKYNWTTSEIDRLDFFQTTRLLFDEDIKKTQEPLVYIDQVEGIPKAF